MTNPEELSLREAIEILSAHNDWRRGLSDTPTNPTRLGKAIDLAIHVLRDKPTRSCLQEKNQ